MCEFAQFSKSGIYNGGLGFMGQFLIFYSIFLIKNLLNKFLGRFLDAAANIMFLLILILIAKGYTNK
jgi:hypothetical protein